MTQKSKIFSTKIYKKLEKKIKDVLNEQTDVLSARTIIIDKVLFVPLEFLSWDCLTLGALGWGQIQK